MTPISTQLPASPISWESEFMLPKSTQTPITYATAGAGILDALIRRPSGARSMLPSTATAANGFANYSTAGVGGATIQFDSKGQRRCMSIQVTGGAADHFAANWRPPDWLPHFGASASCAPGSRVLPGSVVGVFDWCLAADIAAGAPSWPDNVTGIYFQACENLVDAIPGVAAVPDVEGFGVFLNNDGAGGTKFEWVSWGAGAPGPILETIDGPAADPTMWSTLRFVIITGGSGGTLNVLVYLNGTKFVDRFAGTAQMDFLGTTNPSTGPVNAISVGSGADKLYYQMNARFGRYTPDGVEVQGE